MGTSISHGVMLRRHALTDVLITEFVNRLAWMRSMRDVVTHDLCPLPLSKENCFVTETLLIHWNIDECVFCASSAQDPLTEKHRIIGLC